MAITGYVYAIRMINTDYVKIGRTSTDMRIRLDFLQIGNPCLLEVISVCPVQGRAYLLERYVHDLVMEFHLRGEWFCLPQFTADCFYGLIWQAHKNIVAGLPTKMKPRPRGPYLTKKKLQQRITP